MAGKTEWEDALIKHGIMEAPEVKETDDEIQLRMIQKMADRDVLADKSLDELDELEDDYESEVLEKYRYVQRTYGLAGRSTAVVYANAAVLAANKTN